MSPSAEARKPVDRASGWHASGLPLLHGRHATAAVGRVELGRRFGCYALGVQTRGEMQETWVRGGREQSIMRMPGTFVFFPPGDADDAFVWEPRAPVEIRFVLIPPDFLEAVAASEGCALPRSLAPRFGFRDSALEQDLLRVVGLPPDADVLDTHAAARDLVLRLLERGGSAPAWAKDAGRFTRAEARVLHDHVEARLGAGITLAELARLVGLSPGHFARKFGRSFGVSPARFVALRRLQRAIHRLRASDVPLGVLATELGYASQSHFTNAFRTLVGTSPGRYRRERN